MKVEDLYQEIILDHYRAKHHSGLRDPYEAEVHHVNPSCGDEVTLRVHLDGGTVTDVSYEGQGCSISQASTSVMSDLVIGQPVEHGLELHAEFLTLMQSKGTLEPDEDRLEDAIAFAGVSKFPARVKCALLGWSAFKDAALQAQASTPTTEIHDEQGSCPMTDIQTETITSGESRPSDLVRDQLPTDVPSARATVEDLTEALKDVVDPELGINVVDLGLIYGLNLEEDNSLTIDMTLTSAACPLTDVIEDQTATALEGLVENFAINWVWMPPWGMEKITEDGRDQLRALGFNV